MLKILYVPQDSLFTSLKYTSLQRLEKHANITIMQVHSNDKLLLPGRAGLKYNAILDTAKKYIHSEYDYVLCHRNSFLWLVLFRLEGSKTPFAILPHVNYVSAHETF